MWSEGHQWHLLKRQRADEADAARARERHRLAADECADLRRQLADARAELARVRAWLAVCGERAGL